MNPHAWFLKDLDSVPKNGLKVMSTFACGGGSSLGYKLAGCDVIAANDIDPERSPCIPTLTFQVQCGTYSPSNSPKFNQVPQVNLL